jgi:Icc protein
MVVIAHLSDIHIDAEARSADRTTRVIAYLAGLPTPPDAVLITGDIADHGTEPEYERVRELIKLPVPVLYLPGNHDDRGPYRKVLDDDGGDGPINRAHEIAGVLILMADSSIPGRNDGLLDDETLAWLDARLAERPDLPALIAFHHPPVVLGVPFVDNIRQYQEERLAALVDRHPQVVALLCGHAHTPAATTFAGRPLLVAPGVASTLTLPFETDEIVDRTLPPMIAFHLLDDDRRLTTHYRVIP